MISLCKGNNARIIKEERVFKKGKENNRVSLLFLMNQSLFSRSLYPFIDIGKTSFQKIMSFCKEKLMPLSLSHILLDFLMTLRSLSHGPFLSERPRLRK